MVYCDVRLSQFLRIYIDGVPLDLASRLSKFFNLRAKISVADSERSLYLMESKLL